MLLNINVVWRQLLYIPTCSIALPHKEPRLFPVAIGTDQTRRGVCYSGKSILLGREMKVTIATKYSLTNDKSLYSKLLLWWSTHNPPPHPTRTKPGSRTPLHGGDSQSNSEMTDQEKGIWYPSFTHWGRPHLMKDPANIACHQPFRTSFCALIHSPNECCTIWGMKINRQQEGHG